MGVLIVSLYILEVLVSIMLIGIVLIQQSKSQGGLGALAGGTTESIFGASTGNVITKATVTLATIFLTNTLLLAILTSQTGGVASTRSNELKEEADAGTTMMDMLNADEQTASDESGAENAEGAETTTEEAAEEATSTAQAESEATGTTVEDAGEKPEEPTE